MPRARELVAWFAGALAVVAWVTCDNRPRVLVDDAKHAAAADCPREPIANPCERVNCNRVDTSQLT